MKRIVRACLLAGAAGLVAFVAYSDDSQTSSTAAVNCSFQVNPEEHLSSAIRARRDILDRVNKVTQARAAESRGRFAVPASSIPRKNFIDDYIFGKLEALGVPSAPLSTDDEFIRRVYLDLTGRVPTAGQVRAFLSDSNPNKRADLIERLVYSPESTDRWTMWWGDLVGNSANTPVGLSRNVSGRNAFYKYLWTSVADNKPIKDMAYEMVATAGNNYDESTGAANFILNGAVTNGAPIQDTYDMMLLKTATAFLGMGHYDCLLCHNGRGHLDQLSLWGKNASRMQAQQMAAFFSRTNLATYSFPAGTPQTTQQMSFYFNSRVISDRPTGDYALNTRFGNRPFRVAIGNTTTLRPAYHFTNAGARNAGYRSEFAENMIHDPMLAKNFANRLWKAMFGVALAEPVDALDPARLDSTKPPEAPWEFQATHPELLDALARELTAYNFGLKEFIRLLANSSAYQLSSRYSGDWNLAMVGLFARHYPRRLEGEEVHDALVTITGIVPRYTIQNWGNPISYAMQLLDTQEPRSNSQAANFMNLFLRGNRDTQLRSQAGSIQQQLALMNDTFVTTRLKVNASPELQQIARIASNSELAEELYLTFLGRMPSDSERAKAVAHLARSTTTQARNLAIEDLAWVLINRLDFIFSM